MQISIEQGTSIMTRRLILSCVLALSLSACAGMSDTERRTGEGAAIGGVAAGALTGEWGWAAAGAAAGATTGYLYDKHKKKEEAK
jgi:osmotically inducible lipoprotein OsmB